MNVDILGISLLLLCAFLVGAYASSSRSTCTSKGWPTAENSKTKKKETKMKIDDSNAKSRNERIATAESLGIEWCSDEIYRLHGMVDYLKIELADAISDLCSSCCEPSCDDCRWAKLRSKVD